MKKVPEQLPLFEEVPRETMSKYVKYLRGPYSQREVAGIIGIDVSSVENWEQGISRPRPSQIRKLLEHYHEWALRLELPRASSHAAKALGLKADLS